MIEVKGLTKDYGTRRVVDNVSFRVRRGDILGFLGPNGAGKSTTMKIITGYLQPTAGSAFVDGHDVSQSPLEVKKRLGYLPENAPGYPEMLVEEFLHFIAAMRGYRHRPTARARIDRVVGLCHLEPVLSQSLETLSKGYRQRVGFAQALLHDPPGLILDEPTDGLDPNQKNEVRTLIRSMSTDKAIILSTHILEEVEALCTRIIVIANGRILADVSPAEFRARKPGAPIDEIFRELTLPPA